MADDEVLEAEVRDQIRDQGADDDFNATVLHDPSRGLMQVIGGTFAAYHVPGDWA